MAPGGSWTEEHANLAATVQLRLEEVLLSLASWLHERTAEQTLTMAGGVALNCVANSRILREGPFSRIWVQPAAGDAGTALGAALYVAHALGDSCAPMPSAALGRSWSDDELAAWLTSAGVPFERPADIADAVAKALADDQVVAWFQGRSEYGPRALGHRSLLAHPGFARNLERLNEIKGREQFRPVAPMVLLSRAAEVFGSGPVPSPYMLFTHQVREQWRSRLPAVTHVDGSARAQTVDPADEPLAHVTHFNRLFWDCGSTPTTVIEHGIPDPGYRYSGELAAAAVVVNEPVRRGRVTGTDLLPVFSAHCDVDLFGMGTESLGRTDLPHKRLLDELPRRRVYLHPVRWTSLGLSLIEAMHLGMPVAALATTEAPAAVPPAAGVLATDPGALAVACRSLIDDPGSARRAGLAARKHALTRYGLSGDTGIAHLAAAYGRRAVTLAGPVPPRLWGPPPRPWHAVLWKGRRGDPHAQEPDPGLLELRPADVLDAAWRVLKVPVTGQTAVA